MFAPVDSVPCAFVDEVDHNADCVGYDDEHHGFSGASGDCVRNNRVNKDAEDTVGDGLKD